MQLVTMALYVHCGLEPDSYSAAQTITNLARDERMLTNPFSNNEPLKFTNESALYARDDH